MKAKTIVGLMACAVLVPAFADIDNNKATTNDWFSASVSGESVSVTGAAWNTTPAVEGSTTKVMVIDADATTPATLTPTKDGNNKTAADLASDGLVTIASKAYLAPSAKSDLPTAAVLNNAQVGFAVASETVSETTTTNFYAYVRKASTTVNNETVQNGEWIALTGVNPPANEADTEFKIDIDYQNKNVSFSVKVNDAYVALSGTPEGASVSTSSFDFVPVDNSTAKLSDIAAIGSGTITSIDAKFENAVAVGKDGKAYGTIAQAYNTTGEGTVVAWDPSTGAAATGDAANAANGASKAVCMALNVSTTDANAALAFEPTSDTADSIILKTVVDPVDNVTVLFAVKEGDTVKGSGYSASNIAIPKVAGVYTVVPTVGPKTNE